MQISIKGIKWIIYWLLLKKIDLWDEVNNIYRYIVEQLASAIEIWMDISG